MFCIFSAARRIRELELKCCSLNNQVANLEYQLKDAKEVDKFHAESERRAWKSKRFHEARAAKTAEKSKELRSKLGTENIGLKSQLREQNDADLLLIALQGAGLVLSKGAVDKYVSGERLADESVRRRMNNRGVESPSDDLKISGDELVFIANQMSLISGLGYSGERYDTTPHLPEMRKY